jgi:PEP-CTERM motif
VRLRSLFLAAAIALSGAGAANAATLNVQTTPSQVGAVTGLTGGSTLTFDNLAAGQHSSISSGGVTITSSAGRMFVNGDYADNYNTFGQSLTNNGQQIGDFSFEFDTAVNGFGFFIGATDFNWTLTAFDANDNLLDTLVIGVLSGSNAGDFFGILAGGIKRATLTGPAGDHIFLDNFTTGVGGPISAVPEPATWAMMIAGFGLAGAAIRTSRRRQFLVA